MFLRREHIVRYLILNVSLALIFLSKKVFRYVQIRSICHKFRTPRILVLGTSESIAVFFSRATFVKRLFKLGFVKPTLPLNP